MVFEISPIYSLCLWLRDRPTISNHKFDPPFLDVEKDSRLAWAHKYLLKSKHKYMHVSFEDEGRSTLHGAESVNQNSGLVSIELTFFVVSGNSWRRKCNNEGCHCYIEINYLVSLSKQRILYLFYQNINIFSDSRLCVNKT